MRTLLLTDKQANKLDLNSLRIVREQNRSTIASMLAILMTESTLSDLMCKFVEEEGFSDTSSALMQVTNADEGGEAFEKWLKWSRSVPPVYAAMSLAFSIAMCEKSLMNVTDMIRKAGGDEEEKPSKN